MADRIRMEMRGWDELKTGLEQLGPELATRAGRSAIRAGAKALSDHVKDATPVGDDDTSRTYRNKSGESVTVDYGHARDNIKVKMGRPKKAFHVAAYVTFGSAFWARFLEYGTVKMIARPFAKGAFDNAAPVVLEKVRASLSASIERLAKKYGRR
ncbi:MULTISPECIES: HK97-gp10 family putative phage morphogenesis protein [unclassified Sphingobium]|uniref:HK97-gp10 family putative phage morphogenesis protein n=1 Tax=unclassified Sphingobium TaxID=2611147 RepID=UPI0009EAF3F7|nr:MULTISPECIES: HK97-gp10 family putative phage morphogenesis protein [unclassified Sphingobium]